MARNAASGNPESAMLKAIALALLLLVPTTAFAGTLAAVDQAITDNLGDPAQFQVAFDAIQQAVVDDDPEALAEWVSFPINVKMGDKAVTLDDADAFVAAYPALFSKGIKDAVINQKFEDLFVNYQGLMFGNGQIWMSGICKNDDCETVDARIITIQEAY